ncbi:MAG TPA: TspO/MBR family protein [Acidothermaceae bacterium]|nr:TspO/MBR family protein [Acidothermaceae bacterium]
MTDAVAGPSLAPRDLAELRELLVAVAACEAVGLVGGAATARSTREWLPTLDLPPYQPPGWVFGPVWTLLYALMGVSLAGVRRARPAGDSERDRALQLFTVQLACNGLWSFLFFGRRSPRAGLVDAVLIEVALGLTIKAIWKVSRPAALILLPYLAWTTFALVLTADITRRNP